MVTSRSRLIGLTVVFGLLLVVFALTGGWRRRLWKESAGYRQLVTEVERAQVQQREQVSQESQLEAALRKNPDDAAARLQLARLRMTLHGPAAALPVLQPVEEGTSDPGALRALAECYRLVRREDKALALLERAARLAPNDGDVQVDRALLFSLLLWFPQAEATLRTAERLNADPRQIALVRAMMAWQKGNHKEARHILEAALRRYPDDPLLVRQLAIVAHSEGRYAQATQLFEQLARQGADVEALVSLARIHLQQTGAESPEKAILAARKALAVRPQHVQARLQLGRALRLSGKTDEALKVLEALYREHPQTRGLAFELFDIYRAQGRTTAAQPFLAQHRTERQQRQAIRQAVTAVMAFPHRATAHRDMARSCFERGLYGRAIVSCQRTLELDLNLPDVKALLVEAKKKAEQSTATQAEAVESINDQ